MLYLVVHVCPYQVYPMAYIEGHEFCKLYSDTLQLIG